MSLCLVQGRVRFMEIKWLMALKWRYSKSIIRFLILFILIPIQTSFLPRLHNQLYRLKLILPSAPYLVIEQRPLGLISCLMIFLYYLYQIITKLRVMVYGFWGFCLSNKLMVCWLNRFSKIMMRLRYYQINLPMGL